MKKHGNGSKGQILTAPAHPFSGIDVFRDLRDRLSRAAPHPVGLRELAQMMGRSKSTTHFWLSDHHRSPVLGLLALLERLPPDERQAFIASHCREMPTLADPKLSGAARGLKKLLGLRCGMTLVTGSTAAARSYFLTAFCNSWSSRSGLAPTGIDIHRPQTSVPVVGVRYIDEKLAAGQIRALVTSVWPKILTSGARLALFNGLLPAVPEALDDLVQMATKRHVILAESILPDLSTEPGGMLVHLVTLASSEHVAGGIRIRCRAASPAADH